MGACPDWYATFQVAKYLNVAPWELSEQSVWWKYKALTALTAENQAQMNIQKRANSNRRR